ncbi:MAG TPA: sigma-54 dependent transcriptional regulator [Candidatus Acidoferrales bacterium]|nr:sigma-54 dependent transcriptional regulator [Candidatus Acidoferrales bacterium]
MLAPTRNGRIVIIGGDELNVRGYLEMALKCLGHRVALALDGEEVLDILRNSPSDIGAVVLDFTMPRKNGLDTLREIRAVNPSLPVIMISGLMSSANIVAAMKSGASDFLCQPIAHEDLRNAITRAMEAQSIEPRVARPHAAPAGNGVFHSVAPRMREIDAFVAKIGWSEAPVLIQGETGSGKEVLARQLHANSPRANMPFLKLNCAALPPELVESELFGYERGAFTGAFQKKAGMFELANGGTIMLDEIGDMEVRLQAKLLQVLQDYEFHRIGGKETIRVDVRVMAATHRDLEQCIADRSFREDLYYRLNVINMHLPPLRDRREDIVPLVEYFMRKHDTQGTPLPLLTPELRHALIAYNWPGNVRELENVIRRFLIMGNADASVRDLRAKATRKETTPAPPGANGTADLPVLVSAVDLSILDEVVRAKDQAETDAIMTALNTTHWNRKQAATLLKADYKALLYKMKKLGIEGKSGPSIASQDKESLRSMAVAQR